MIILGKLFRLVLGDPFIKAGLFLLFCTLFGKLYVIIASADPDVPFLVTDGEAIGTHSGETFRKLLVHCFNGSNDTNESHDAKSNDGYCQTRAQLITADRSGSKR